MPDLTRPVVPGSTADLLKGMPRRALTPEQQLEALRRVQSQAEQRVRLGMQLFKAAEARITAQGDVIKQVRESQDQLREQVQEDVSKTLHSYDQWLGQIDESFTGAIKAMEEKIDAVKAEVDSQAAKVEHMLARAEQLLEQAEHMNIAGPVDAPAIAPTVQPVAQVADAATEPTEAPAPQEQASQPAEPVATVEIEAEAEADVEAEMEAEIDAEADVVASANEPAETDESELAADALAQALGAAPQPEASNDSEAEAPFGAIDASKDDEEAEESDSIYSEVLERLRNRAVQSRSRKPDGSEDQAA